MRPSAASERMAIATSTLATSTGYFKNLAWSEGITKRLLYLRSQEGHWFRDDELYGRHPSFKQLIDTWFEREGKPVNSRLYKQFDRIRHTRNQVVHQAAPMTAKAIGKIWRQPNSMSEDSDDTAEEAAYHLMLEKLQNVCDRAWQ